MTGYTTRRPRRIQKIRQTDKTPNFHTFSNSRGYSYRVPVKYIFPVGLSRRERQWRAYRETGATYK